MATSAQIEANRRNAQKSTGPRTSEGKFRVSQNALTHGMTAERLVINTENRSAFDALYEKMIKDLAPVGSVELALAERIIALTWRMKRADWMETGVFNVLGKNNEVVNRVDRSLLRSDPTDFSQIVRILDEALNYGSTRKFRNAVQQLAELIAPNSTNPKPQTVLGCIAIEDFRDNKMLERLMRYQGEIERSLYKAILELQKLQTLRKKKQADKQNPQSQKNETNPISKGLEIT